VEKHWDP
jgi:hypothetical protein